MLSAVDASYKLVGSDVPFPRKRSGKKIVSCGCAFANSRNWHCCDAVNDANWAKKEKSDRKLARTAASLLRKKARTAERTAMKKQTSVGTCKKFRLKRPKCRKQL